MTKLFTYQEIGNTAKHTVISADDEAQAQELIGSGNAVRLDLPELDKAEKQANDLHDKYEADIRRIKETDNPLLMDEKVQAYELEKLEKEYRAKSAEVEQEYKQWRNQQIKEAKTRAAQAVVKVAENDREVARQFKDRASLKLAGSGDKGESVERIKNEINLLTDSQKVALQSHTSELLAGIESTSNKQAIIDAVQDIRNDDLLSVKVATQLPGSVLTKQRTKDIARRVVSESSSTGKGGISPEFYKKNLKR